MPVSELRVGGFVPFSTVDRPGELTATVFTQGCPWRCPYCHNPHLLEAGPGLRDATGGWTWEQVLTVLDTRRGLLDGVVFSGGEPTIQSGLPDAMREVKAQGFAVHLHTGGPLPGALAEVLPLLAWVGFDIKAPFDEYERVTTIAGSGARARESLRSLAHSGVPFEVRTTVHPDYLGVEELERVADDLAAEGIDSWVLQNCRAQDAGPGVSANIPPARLNALRRRIQNISLR
ncbi:MAG: anaerobic ribonucleoside-triphosphate reductase activating protein [Coriobacteriia bacterium]